MWHEDNRRKTCSYSSKLLVIMSDVLRILQSFLGAVSWYHLVSEGQGEHTLSVLDSVKRIQVK